MIATPNPETLNPKPAVDNGTVKILRLFFTPANLEPEPLVDVVEDEVYEVRDQGEGGGELPVSRHGKAHNESDGHGYGPPGDGLG
jgi:hypothetical protein